MEGWVSPGPGCKEQLAHGCYATACGQRDWNPNLLDRKYHPPKAEGWLTSVAGNIVDLHGLPAFSRLFIIGPCVEQYQCVTMKPDCRASTVDMLGRNLMVAAQAMTSRMSYRQRRSSLQSGLPHQRATQTQTSLRNSQAGGDTEHAPSVAEEKEVEFWRQEFSWGWGCLLCFLLICLTTFHIVTLLIPPSLWLCRSYFFFRPVSDLLLFDDWSFRCVQFMSMICMCVSMILWHSLCKVLFSWSLLQQSYHIRLRRFHSRKWFFFFKFFVFVCTFQQNKMQTELCRLSCVEKQETWMKTDWSVRLQCY